MRSEIVPLDAMRHEARLGEEGLLKRLSRFGDERGTPPARNAAAATQTWHARATATLRSFANRVALVARAAWLVPAFAAQSLRIRSNRRHSRVDADCLAISVGSKRLPPLRSVGVREQLAALATPLPSREGAAVAAPIASKIRDAAALYIVDPLPVSELWALRREFARERVFLFDGASLATTVAADLVRHPLRAIHSVRSAREQAIALRREGTSASAAVVWFRAQADRTFDRHLSAFGSTEALLFTSNSTLTEVLRSQQIRSPTCRGLQEILHGVGSTDSEHFFREIAAAAEEHGKRHTFVPQIPGLPLYGAIAPGPRDSAGAQIAINTHLNSYLLRRRSEGGSFERFVEREFARIAPNDQPGDSSLLVAVLGNSTTTGPYRSSEMFRAECTIIEKIAEWRRAAKRPCTILYVPHPVNRDLEFDAPAFIQNGVVIYADSIFSWLVADASVSIHSSALFEAAYFGMPTFTPIVPSDGIFTADYLDLVGHPSSTSRQDFEAALEQALRTAEATRPMGVVEKAARRIAMTSWSWPA